MIFSPKFLGACAFAFVTISSLTPSSPALASAPAASGASKLGCTPDEALERLLDGNKRYIESRFELCRDTTAQLREEIAKGQHPFAVVVSCSDSRLPPEIIFDKKPGEIFVVRVAGNTVDPIGLASIEYALDHLGASLILVLGHERCGAVTAAYDTFSGKASKAHAATASHTAENHDSAEDEEKTERSRKKVSNMGTLLNLLKPAVKNVIAQKKNANLSKAEMVELAVDENIRLVAKNILKNSPAIRKMVDGDKVRIAAGKFDLDDGTVKLIGRKQCTWVTE